MSRRRNVKRVVNTSEILDMTDSEDCITPIKGKRTVASSRVTTQRPSGARSILADIYHKNREANRLLRTDNGNSQPSRADQPTTSRVETAPKSLGTQPAKEKLRANKENTSPSRAESPTTSMVTTAPKSTATLPDKSKTPSSLLRSLLGKSPSHQSPNTGSGHINSAGTDGTVCNHPPITASTPIASTFVSPTSRAEHSNCSAKIQELTQMVEKSIERKDTDCLSSEDHSISRSTYACLHKEFDVLETLSSPHNSAVSILYQKALTAHGFSKKQCLKLIRQCFKRLKHAARPKSNKEIACRQKVRRKDIKLVYRKRKQNDTEKALYPITYEMMSSEDEDEQGPFRRVKSFLTDETKEHIEELDRRARKVSGARTKVKECQPSLKLIGNRCVIY